MSSFQRSAEVLEFTRVREMLARLCATEGAREAARELLPSSDYDTVCRLLSQTAAALALEVKKGAPPFGGMEDPADALDRACKGAALTPGELLSLAGVLRATSSLLAYFRGVEELPSPLGEYVSLLLPNAALERKITSAIPAPDLIADDASPTLLELRRRERILADRVKDRLASFLTGERAKFLQEKIVTTRDGRYVVPVKLEYKSEVRGIVHGMSASGATLFIEPVAVVEANNDLRELEEEEQKEISRILLALSALCAENAGLLSRDYAAASALDFIFARAALAMQMDARDPVILRESSPRALYFPRARHPLLDPAKVVPVDIVLGYPPKGGAPRAARARDLAVKNAFSREVSPGGEDEPTPDDRERERGSVGGNGRGRFEIIHRRDREPPRPPQYAVRVGGSISLEEPPARGAADTPRAAPGAMVPPAAKSGADALAGDASLRTSAENPPLSAQAPLAAQAAIPQQAPHAATQTTQATPTTSAQQPAQPTTPAQQSAQPKTPATSAQPARGTSLTGAARAAGSAEPPAGRLFSSPRLSEAPRKGSRARPGAAAPSQKTSDTAQGNSARLPQSGDKPASAKTTTPARAKVTSQETSAPGAGRATSQEKSAPGTRRLRSAAGAGENPLAGEGYDTLVITGPNTGGKTVALKTIGLLAMMAQAGLQIPTAEGALCSVFTGIFADIGDEQSIEQSLSTFSAHMTNIVAIERELDSRSLVLFDELGAGTDPVEGAALAIAILERTRERGALCVATTHYAELKAFALETPGVCNAACEFDLETLTPTYRLLIGAPGKSNAFAISEKLGLPPEITARARELLSGETRRFESVLARLEEDRAAMERAREEAAAAREEAEIFARKERASLEKSLEEERRAAKRDREQAETLLLSAKASADYVLRELDEARKAKTAQELAQAQRGIRQRIAAAEEEVTPSLGSGMEDEDYTPPRPFRRGDEVRIVALGKDGYLENDPDKNGNVSVRAGILTTRTNVKGLRLLRESVTVTDAAGRTHPASSYNLPSKGVQFFSPEMDIRGEMAEDGWLRVDKYLDDAVLAHAPTVRIIHGKGTGALRARVREELRRDKRVRSFRSGEMGEGDSGVTVVELRV